MIEKAQNPFEKQFLQNDFTTQDLLTNPPTRGSTVVIKIIQANVYF
jgi:hypothetical protein